MVRAWLAATVVLIGGLVLYAVTYKLVRGTFVADAIIWSTPGIASFVAAILASRSRVAVGLGVIFPAALLMGIGNFVLGKLGYMDLVGIKVSIIVAILALPVVTIPCAIGTLAGDWLAKRRANA